mmetsp:Transcript_137219/g.342085  ORF Transcript_137219/g.342085 Transcript_137219/m.342085 type:complete len:311 (+) Transcript_137219:165-1097(+)
MRSRRFRPTSALSGNLRPAIRSTSQSTWRASGAPTRCKEEPTLRTSRMGKCPSSRQRHPQQHGWLQRQMIMSRSSMYSRSRSCLRRCKMPRRSAKLLSSGQPEQRQCSQRPTRRCKRFLALHSSMQMRSLMWWSSKHSRSTSFLGGFKMLRRSAKLLCSEQPEQRQCLRRRARRHRRPLPCRTNMQRRLRLPWAKSVHCSKRRSSFRRASWRPWSRGTTSTASGHRPRPSTRNRRQHSQSMRASLRLRSHAFVASRLKCRRRTQSGMTSRSWWRCSDARPLRPRMLRPKPRLPRKPHPRRLRTRLHHREP